MTTDKKQLFRETEYRLHNYKYLNIQINNIQLDIEREKNDYRGCSAISYDERTGNTYSINRTIENEVIAKEHKIEKLTKDKIDKEIEKKKIDNALTCLNIIETDFFNLFYKSMNKNSVDFISSKMHIDRSHCYRIRERVVYKIMSMLYPYVVLDDMPLFNEMR